MDSMTLVPSEGLRPRGFMGLAAAALRGAFLSLPGLLALAAAWALVVGLAGLVAAVPVLVAGSLSRDMATVVGALMALVCLPFLVIWLSAGWSALLAWIASRTLRAPLGLGEALGLGVRRALPVLGTAFGIKLLGALSLMPAAFLAMAVGLLAGQETLPGGTWAAGLLRAAALMAAIAALGGLYICLRLVLAPWAALLEEAGPFEAIGRAWELSRGQSGRLLGYILLALGLVALALDGLARLWQGDEGAALAALVERLPTASRFAGLPASALGDPEPLLWLLLAAGIVIGAVTLVHAAMSAFYVDLLYRKTDFGAISPPGLAPVSGDPVDGDPVAGAPVDDNPVLVDPAGAPVPVDEAADGSPSWWDGPLASPEAHKPIGVGMREDGTSPATLTVEPASLDRSATDDDNRPVDPELDLASLQGISLATGRPEEPALPRRRSRLAWLWSWLPEPETRAEDE